MVIRSLKFGIASTILLLVPLIAQEPGPPPGPPSGPPPGARGDRPGMPAPKNLKLLQPAELMPTMNFFKTSLGVECSFCHVHGDFASDENPHKNIARGMITMARDINAKYPDVQTHVTCYTCHRGAEEPLSGPATAEAKAPAAGF